MICEDKMMQEQREGMHKLGLELLMMRKITPANPDPLAEIEHILVDQTPAISYVLTSALDSDTAGIVENVSTIYVPKNQLNRALNLIQPYMQ